MSEPAFITVDAAEHRLSVSNATVQSLVRIGRLPTRDGQPDLVDAAAVAMFRSAGLERLHGCDTACQSRYPQPWNIRWQMAWWMPRYDRCLHQCLLSGESAGMYRWARRLGWRLAGGDPEKFPHVPFVPQPQSGMARLGCVLPVAVVVLVGVLAALLLSRS